MSLSNGASHPIEPPSHTNDADIQDQSPHTAGSSDGEGGERTAREQLRNTSIAGMAKSDNVTQTTTPHNEEIQTTISAEVESANTGATHAGQRGRPSKKRSFEDLQQDDGNVDSGSPSTTGPAPKKGQHKRMRSREVENDPMTGTYSGKTEDVTSPPPEESDHEAQETPGGPGILVEAGMEEDENCQISIEDTPRTEQPDTNQQVKPSAEITDTSETPVEAPTVTKDEPTSSPQPKTSSGFANTSSTSPFGSAPPAATPSIEQSSETQPTSSSAFASSGLSAFAKTDSSPFGTARSTTPLGGFGGGGSTTTSAFGTSRGFGSSGGFGGGGSSTFGNSSTSGFGGSSTFGGGAFGSTKPFGSGPSAFGGLTSTTSSGGAFPKAKPFGATQEDEEEGSENGDDADNEGQNDEDAGQQDTRFVQQDLETGEEDEETIFTCRAKLYHFEKEWKERGVGTFKINIKYESKVLSGEGSTGQNDVDKLETTDPSEDVEAGQSENAAEEKFWTTERRARLIMRTDGVHRVVLNTPVFKDMKVGTAEGMEPNGKTMHLSGLEDGRPQAFQIRIGKEDVLKELYHKIHELKAEL